MADDAEPAGGATGEASVTGPGSVTGNDELAVSLSQLARSLHQQDDPARTLAKIVAASVALIPGAAQGSISVVTARKHVESRAATGKLPEQMDAAQAETGQGPCLDAAFDDHTVRVPDMRAERRWPAFSRRAVEAGAMSMLCFQLYVEDDNLGALNLYADDAGAFTDESEHVGLLFASHAAVALAGARKQSQLMQAMATRDLIGQAKGILMERYKITADQAFTLLVEVSQSRNRKLRDVAEELVRTGGLAGPQA